MTGVRGVRQPIAGQSLVGNSGSVPAFAQQLSFQTVATALAPYILKSATFNVVREIKVPVGANPTATAGPTAVNGTATTFMRSDAAPAVQKASAAQFGIVEVDGTTITASSGVISATPTTVPVILGSGAPFTSEPTGWLYSRTDQAGLYSSVITGSASPTTDGSVKGNITFNSSSANVTLVTTHANDVNVCIVSYSKASGGTLPTTTSVVGSRLGAYTLRSRKTQAGGGSGNAGPVAVEIWTAQAAASGSDTITATLSAAVDGGSMVAFGVNGCASISTPFDPNGGLPDSAGGNTASSAQPPAVTYSTTNAFDLVIFACEGASGTGGVVGGVPAGFTLIQNNEYDGGADWTNLSVGYLAVSAAQSGATAQSPVTRAGSYISIVDAFTATTQAWEFLAPITGAGSPTQSANLVLAGPTSGSAASPAFRSLVTADLPSIASSNLSDVTYGTWTPTDQSGAGLTITVNYANYIKIGKFSMLSFSITYPSTANVTAALLSAPFSPYTDSKPGPAGSANSQYTACIGCFINSSGIIEFFTGTGGGVTNAEMSTLTTTATIICQNAS